MEGVSVQRQELLQTILLELEKLYQTVCQEGFAPILVQWRALSVCSDKSGRQFHWPDVYWNGADIDDDGNLIVETEGGLEKVMAGDVHVRPV